MQRRQFIVAAGATAALAGCLGDGGGDDTDSPESVVTALYEAADDADNRDEYLDELEDLVHSESPYLTELEEGDGGEVGQQSLDTVETEVLAEDLDAEEIEAEFALAIDFWSVEDALIDDLAEENAHVSAEAAFESAEDETAEYLTVTEDGDWVVFFPKVQVG